MGAGDIEGFLPSEEHGWGGDDRSLHDATLGIEPTLLRYRGKNSRWWWSRAKKRSWWLRSHSARAFFYNLHLQTPPGLAVDAHSNKITRDHLPGNDLC